MLFFCENPDWFAGGKGAGIGSLRHVHRIELKR